MAIYQAWLDECEKEIREQFLEELTHYYRLQQAWVLGPLKLSRRKGMLQIWSQYVDIENNRLCQAFLGSGRWPSAWASTLQCMKHVKSIGHRVFFPSLSPPKYYIIK